MEGLYKLKEMLLDELYDYGMKGEMSAGTLDVVDKLAHAAKNVSKVILMSEDEDEGHSMYSPMSYNSYDGNSYRGEYGGRSGRSYRGGSYDMSGGRSYARGRGRYAKRDSMGRYSSADYSRASDEIVSQLEDMKEIAKDDRTRSEIQKLIEKMQNK